MKKLVLTIGLLVTAVANVYSQTDDVKKYDNDKIINYILQGKYQKVIDISKSSLDTSFSITDQENNISLGVRYNHTNPIADSVFIQCMKRLQTLANVTDIKELVRNPMGVRLESETYSLDSPHTYGTKLPNTKVYVKRYILTSNTHTYIFAFSVTNTKFDGMGFMFYLNEN